MVDERVTEVDLDPELLTFEEGVGAAHPLQPLALVGETSLDRRLCGTVALLREITVAVGSIMRVDAAKGRYQGERGEAEIPAELRADVPEVAVDEAVVLQIREQK